MKLTQHQTRLLTAIDSKDFANVAEVLHLHGPVELPGIRFTWCPGGRVLVEYDPDNPKVNEIKTLDNKFSHRWGLALRRYLRGDRVRVPTMPRFKLVPSNPQTKLILT